MEVTRYLFLVWNVSMVDEPLEDLVPEERELPAARWALCRDDIFSRPSPDDLFARRQKVGELLGVHHR